MHPTLSILSQSPVHPTSPPPIPTTPIPLSVLDAVSANYSPCGALWAFSSAISPERLRNALAHTLNQYPQFTGKLEPVPYAPGRRQSHGHGRLQVSVGRRVGSDCTDPGLLLIVAEHDQPLESVFPDTAQQHCQHSEAALDMSSIPMNAFLPSSPLPRPLDPHSDHIAPLHPAQVQLTSFSCSGCTLGVTIAHPLSDAQTLVQFVHQIASTYRSLSTPGSATDLPPPIFDPQLVDRAAAGNINADHPDPALIAIAHALPQHRFDFWSSADGCPTWAVSDCTIPPQIDPASIKTDPMGNGIPLPWTEWDASIPTKRYTLHFTAHEVHAMWKVAQGGASQGIRLSHLDALLAHLWFVVNRARAPDLPSSPTEVYMSNSLGVRERLGLPSTLCGSPIIHARVSTVVGDTAKDHHSELSELATAIRASTAAFTRDAIAAALHELVHCLYPPRTWTGFLGCRNVLVTSWLRLNARDVNFHGSLEGRPRYVEAFMPTIDGLVQIMEGGAEVQGDDADPGRTRDWWASGASVVLCLTAQAMDRVLIDPFLRCFAGS